MRRQPSLPRLMAQSGLLPLHCVVSAQLQVDGGLPRIRAWSSIFRRLILCSTCPLISRRLYWDFLGSPDVKESACSVGDQDSIPGLRRSPGEGMATHSSILAWRIPWTEEPGRLQSMGSQRVGHDLAIKQQQGERNVLHLCEKA